MKNKLLRVEASDGNAKYVFKNGEEVYYIYSFIGTFAYIFTPVGMEDLEKIANGEFKFVELEDYIVRESPKPLNVDDVTEFLKRLISGERVSNESYIFLKESKKLIGPGGVIRIYGSLENLYKHELFVKYVLGHIGSSTVVNARIDENGALEFHYRPGPLGNLIRVGEALYWYDPSTKKYVSENGVSIEYGPEESIYRIWVGRVFVEFAEVYVPWGADFDPWNAESILDIPKEYIIDSFYIGDLFKGKQVRFIEIDYRNMYVIDAGDERLEYSIPDDMIRLVYKGASKYFYVDDFEIVKDIGDIPTVFALL